MFLQQDPFQEPRNTFRSISTTIPGTQKGTFFIMKKTKQTKTKPTTQKLDTLHTFSPQSLFKNQGTFFQELLVFHIPSQEHFRNSETLHIFAS